MSTENNDTGLEELTPEEIESLGDVEEDNFTEGELDVIASLSTSTTFTVTTNSTSPSGVTWLPIRIVGETDSTFGVDPIEQKEEVIEIDEKDKEEAVADTEVKPEYEYTHKDVVKKHRREEIKQDRTVGQMMITKDDLIIEMRSEKNIYHMDIEGEHLVEDLNMPYEAKNFSYGDRGKIIIKNSLLFDKDMNYLIIDNFAKAHKFRTIRGKRRISGDQYQFAGNNPKAEGLCFVIINKKLFVESRGKTWKIRHKQNLGYPEIMEMRREYIQSFHTIDIARKHLTSSIEKIHPKEEYDLLFDVKYANRYGNKGSEYAICLLQKNVTIKNSIELEHYIGDIMVMSLGFIHNTSDKRERNIPHIALHGIFYGMRLTFDVGDGNKGYHHSHLPSKILAFDKTRRISQMGIT